MNVPNNNNGQRFEGQRQIPMVFVVFLLAGSLPITPLVDVEIPGDTNPTNGDIDNDGNIMGL